MTHAAAFEIPIRGRRRRSLFALTAAAACAALVVGFLAFTGPAGAEDETIRLNRAEVEAVTNTGEAYCLDEFSVCITQPEPGLFAAVHTLDTHPHFRAHGCYAVWRTDVDPSTFGAEGIGLYREGCGESVYDERGRRLFGPAPGDLFTLNVVDEGDQISLRYGLESNEWPR